MRNLALTHHEFIVTADDAAAKPLRKSMMISKCVAQQQSLLSSWQDISFVPFEIKSLPLLSFLSSIHTTICSMAMLSRSLTSALDRLFSTRGKPEMDRVYCTHYILYRSIMPYNTLWEERLLHARPFKKNGSHLYITYFLK